MQLLVSIQLFILLKILIRIIMPLWVIVWRKFPLRNEMSCLLLKLSS